MIKMDNDVTGEHNASFLQYLTFLQDIVTRMNRNAFQLKGWCITIVAALAALATNNASWGLLLVAALATLPFGFLDAYYLLMERQFRGLYNDVVKGCEDIKIFSMPINRYFLKNQSTAENRKKYNYWRVLGSGSVSGFYLPLFGLCVLSWIGCLFLPINKCGMPLSYSGENFNAQEGTCVLPKCGALELNRRQGCSIGEESYHWEHKWR